MSFGASAWVFTIRRLAMPWPPWIRHSAAIRADGQSDQHSVPSRYFQGMSDRTWIYEPSPDNGARTLLGTEGERPLVCIGVNPSTAAPGNLDRTVATVGRVAAYAGFNGFMMLNVYAQRATDPHDIHLTLDHELHDWNLRSIASFVDGRNLTVWAAWGTLIRKRAYLPGLLTEIVALPELSNCRWRSRGNRSKAGHPHHLSTSRMMRRWISSTSVPTSHPFGAASPGD